MRVNNKHSQEPLKGDRKTAAPRDSAWLGWNPVEVWLGNSLFDEEQPSRVDLGWKPGGIRNCSYAPQPHWIGITAEDRTNGRQVLAVYERHTKATRVLQRLDYILHHALDQTGDRVCYTQPSARSGTADLYLYDVHNKQSCLLLEGAVAQSSVPAWFPDTVRIAFHSPEGHIKVLDCATGKQELVGDGEMLAVSPDGGRIACRRDNQLLILNQRDGLTRQFAIRRGLWQPRLTDGLSWSPDGACLSVGTVAGLVGKDTRFYLLEVAGGSYRKMRLKHLSGLLLIPDVNIERRELEP
jgi:hypothetical protein